MARKSKGKQRIEMVRMTNETNLQVTFSKRKSGMFKKASELCTLTGAEVAIVVFSPGRKAFSFGHPSVNEVVNRYLGYVPEHATRISQIPSVYRDAMVQQLSNILSQVSLDLDNEKKTGDELNQIRKDIQRQKWWVAPIDDLNLEQLREYQSALQDLYMNVSMQLENPVQPFYNLHTGSSSAGAGLGVEQYGFEMDGALMSPSAPPFPMLPSAPPLLMPPPDYSYQGFNTPPPLPDFDLIPEHGPQYYIHY